MKLAKNIKTLVCDDVRNEVGGKISLMGIYSSDMYVAQTPAILPSVYLVIMLEKVKQSFTELYISLYMPAEPNPISFEYPAVKGVKVGSDTNMVVGVTPFKINAVGDCRFEIRFKKDSDPVITHPFSIKIRTPQN
ncbi:MAG TPA: hypothetical protein PLU81_16575 [Deltaproteobacteria bacterium]|nr:hypothetical protein [Deltaproteobacteria bacterium]